MDIQDCAILIYENEPADVALIRYCAEELGGLVFVADSPDKVLEHLSTQPISIAFVNLLLKKVSFPDSVQVVAMGNTGPLVSLKILQCRSACFLPKPLSTASVMLGLQKATKAFLEKESFIAAAVNLSTLLNEVHIRFAGFAKNPVNKMTFIDSIKGHCFHCIFARRSDQINSEEGYEVALFSAEHGTIYCQHRDDCRLMAFAEYLSTNMEGASSRSSMDVLESAYQASKEETFLAMLREVSQQYEDFLDRLNLLKRQFCVNACEKHKKDLAYKKGDTLLGSARDMLEGHCAYCPEDKCPLDNYFELFTRKIM